MRRQREGSVVSACKMVQGIEQGVPKRLSAHASRERQGGRRGNANGNLGNTAYQSSVDVGSMDIGASSAADALEEELTCASEDFFPSSSAQLDDFDARLMENSAVFGTSADLQGLCSGSSVSSSLLRMGRFTRPVNTVRSSIQRQVLRHADFMGINERAAVAPVAAPLLSRAKPSLLSQNSSRRVSGQRVVPTRNVGAGEARGVLTSSASKIVKEAVSEEEMERQIEAELDINCVRALPNRGDSDSDEDY